MWCIVSSLHICRNHWHICRKVIHYSGKKKVWVWVLQIIPPYNTLSEETAHSTVYHHLSTQSSCIKTAQGLLRWRCTVGWVVSSESVVRQSLMKQHMFPSSREYIHFNATLAKRPVSLSFPDFKVFTFFFTFLSTTFFCIFVELIL